MSGKKRLVRNRIKCLKCGRSIMLPRIEFNKKLKKVVKLEGDTYDQKN